MYSLRFSNLYQEDKEGNLLLILPRKAIIDCDEHFEALFSLM